MVVTSAMRSVAPDHATSVQPLRIGYLVQQFLPEVGAGPARVAEMALRWREAGAEVVVITAMPNRPEGRIYPGYRGKFVTSETWNGIRVLRSWLYASPKPGFVRTVVNNATFMATGALHGILRAGRLDVLVASSPPFFVHLAGAMHRALRRMPLVLEVRDLWPDYLVGMGMLRDGVATRALFALERSLLRQASRVVVVTESFRERIIGKGVDRSRIDLVPNGVDTTVYYPTAEPPPIPELHRRGSEFIVGYLGNFGAGQSLTHVIEAAARLKDVQPDIRFVLVGDGPERERVERHAQELGSTNVAIRGPIPKDRTRAFYNACDVCLVPLAPFPILQETIPSKIFEVMACARPVLASLDGEAREIVERSGGGIVTPPGRPDLLAEAIVRLRDMGNDERQSLGQRGREYVARNFDRGVLARRYLDALRRAAADGARSRTVRSASDRRG